MGHALVAAMAGARGPFGRGFSGEGFDVVILAVPDAAIASAAALITGTPIVGHCSGASGLDVLAPHEAFSVHPLMSVTSSIVGGTTGVPEPASDASPFVGASAAVAGSTPKALDVARSLVSALGMRAVEIEDEDRAAYHAAASIAANFLITLEDAAESLMIGAGGDRAMLLPLVRAALENWATFGGPAALTGPVARGDEATISRQREAVAARAPHFLDLFDVLTAHTRQLANRRPA